jgi:hypothetical protein
MSILDMFGSEIWVIIKSLSFAKAYFFGSRLSLNKFPKILKLNTVNKINIPGKIHKYDASSIYC